MSQLESLQVVAEEEQTFPRVCFCLGSKQEVQTTSCDPLHFKHNAELEQASWLKNNVYTGELKRKKLTKTTGLYL